MSFSSPKSYDITPLYRDSTLYLQALTHRIINVPHIVQYTFGEMAIKDALKIVELIKLAYESSNDLKLKYLYELAEYESNEEVIVNQLFENKYITLDVKAELYKLLGSMKKQIKGWINSTAESQI